MANSFSQFYLWMKMFTCVATGIKDCNDIPLHPTWFYTTSRTRHTFARLFPTAFHTKFPSKYR